ncbi:MAG TPA: HAD-IIB family hydrolase [Bacillota bacterium]|jgi:HAD superfamily hydrolase (TIGR01484 family)
MSSSGPRRPTAVLSDIDGCLYDFTQPPDLGAYAWLRSARARAGSPSFSLVTGRSVEFVKVFAVILGLRESPHLCELGSLVVEGVGSRVLVHPRIEEYGVTRLRRDRVNLLEAIAERIGPVEIEPSRDFTLSLIAVGGHPACDSRDQVEGVVREAHPEARVFTVGEVLDIALVPVSKADGLDFLRATYPGFDPSSILAIGDSENDLDLFAAAGWRGAPANATDAVKAAADYVSPHPGLAGVQDILRTMMGWE